MEKIYIVGFILGILELILYLFSPIFFLIFSIFLLLYLFYILKLKKFEIYIVSLIFIFRAFIGINFYDYKVGDIVKIKSDFIECKGKIEKIDNKKLLFNKNIYLEKIPNGKFEILGEIKEINKRYIVLNEIERKEISQNFSEIFFEKKIKVLRKYLSNGCVNLIETMILGEKRVLYKEIQESFIRCGIAHLLAISGFHIGIICGIILFILDKIGLRKEIKNIMGILILSLYVYSIKISPSVIRSYIMIVVFLIGNIIYEKNDIKKAFMVAFILNLLIYPNSLGSISFIMSYLSVFIILWIYPKLKIDKKIKNSSTYNFLIFLFIIQIGLMPITLYFFKTINILSFFTNIILMPFGSFFIVIGFFSVLLPEFLLKLFSFIIQGSSDIFEILLLKFEKIPYLTIEIKREIDFSIIIFMIVIVLLLLFKKEKN